MGSQFTDDLSTFVPSICRLRLLIALYNLLPIDCGQGCMIYLDHNATTPVLREAMMPYLTEEWGNPSSAYRFGSKLKTVIEAAREQVAELIGRSRATSCSRHAARRATTRRFMQR